MLLDLNELLLELNILTFMFFLQEQYGNDIFVLKYEKYSVIMDDMCTTPCSGPITSRSNKWMTGFRLYSTSDIENYQLMILDEFVAN